MDFITQRCIDDVDTELKANQQLILNKSVTWASVADKVLQSDGSFKDGTDTNKTIRASIEPINQASDFERIMLKDQGIVEESTHFMNTLLTHDIQANDNITYSGTTYRITYVIPKQFNIDYTQALLKINN